MDYETVPAPEFGRSLGAISVNLLVRDVLAEVAFPIGAFNMQANRASGGFAIVLHADHTFGAYPLLSRRPSDAPRGGGIELRPHESRPQPSSLQDLPGSLTPSCGACGHDKLLAQPSQAARLLPFMRRVADVADGGAPGGPCIPHLPAHR